MDPGVQFVTLPGVMLTNSTTPERRHLVTRLTAHAERTFLVCSCVETFDASHRRPLPTLLPAPIEECYQEPRNYPAPPRNDSDVMLEVFFPVSGTHIFRAAFVTYLLVSKRLYFLKQLRRAGVPPQQLLPVHFYTAVIRPVLENASPVWHYSITRAQSHHLESIQKPEVHIIFSVTRGMSYPNIICCPLKLINRQTR